MFQPAIRSVVLILFLSSLAVAEEPPKGEMRIDARVALHANGDGAAAIVLDLSPADYARVKGQVPNPFQFLRDFRSNRSNYELAPGAACRYDDATTAIRMELVELGAVRNLGNGCWALEIEPGPEFVDQRPGEDGRTVVHFHHASRTGDDLPFGGRIQYSLPEGAADVRWMADERRIEYRLPAPAGTGAGRLAVDFQIRDRLMATTYKVYGLGSDFHAQWVAKAVLRNFGTNACRDVRVRYRLSGYAEWSAWQKYPEVAPGQTAVSVYYPVIDQRIASLRTNTPADVDVEWRYDDGEGTRVEDSDGGRTVILGAGEYVFSNLTTGESLGTWQDDTNNAPLIAAWVSRNEPVVKEFAAVANKLAGGVGASSDDAQAMKAVAAIYDLFLLAGITYQHPAGLVDRATSFDPKSVQNVQFPRDTLRNKSGTCIDLAILFAACAHSLGLEPFLALVPGHCFPLVRLPSGSLAAVETTCVRGGLRFGSAVGFDQALAAGAENWQKALADGRVHEIDLRALWTRGIANPELPELPADVLATWGLDEATILGRTGDARRAATGTAVPAAPAAVGGFDGSWIGTANEQLPDGRVLTYPVELLVETSADGRVAARAVAQVSVETYQGWLSLRLEQLFEGRAEGGRIRIAGVRKVLTDLSTGQAQECAPDQGWFELRGGSLVASVAGSECVLERR